MQIPRRQILTSAMALTFSSGLPAVLGGMNRNARVADESRIRGLLIGGLLGDALGGPVEFSESPLRHELLCNARGWPGGTVLDDSRLKSLSSSLVLSDYTELRPEPAAYGPWRSNAPAGTVTDDSRHKMVLLRAIRAANQEKRKPVVADVARAFLEFAPIESGDWLTALCEEGLREYRYAARWVLGERDLTIARPVERLWAGVNNCSGQMLMPPLAACYPGDADAAYRAAFELNFVDTPLARDITAAVVAGMAAVLDPKLDGSSIDQRWRVLLHTMQQVDPYRFQDVPYAGRQLDRWMRLAVDLAERADGSPARLFKLLESEGDPVYWWDAHFTLLVPLSILHLCRFSPLASMHLTLDFGHDTDSYAQLLGCLIGAVHGEELFPLSMREAVAKTVRQDFGEDVDVWPEVLNASAMLATVVH